LNFDVAELGIVGAGADEVEIVALGIPRGSAKVEEVVSDAVSLTIGHAPNVEGAEIIGIVEQ